MIVSLSIRLTFGSKNDKGWKVSFTTRVTTNNAKVALRSFPEETNPEC